MAKSENQSLYEWILEIREDQKIGREKVTNKVPLQPLQPLQDALSLCKNENNFVTVDKGGPLQNRYTKQNQDFDFGDDPQQAGNPAIPATHQADQGADSQVKLYPDAELLSDRLEYLSGITGDLTGWKLWRRLDGNYEYRFALDPSGTIRWCRRYPLPTESQCHQTEKLEEICRKTAILPKSDILGANQVDQRAMDPGNDEQIHLLENKIMAALTGQAVPIQLSQAETITDPAKFARAMARDYFSSCKWVRQTASRHLQALGISIEG